MLGTAARVAAATVAAGVLVEQVGTRPAYADNLGSFSSRVSGTPAVTVSGTPAVTVSGTNGARGIVANCDSYDAITATSASNYAIQAARGTAGAGPGIGVKGTATTGVGV